MSIGPWRASAKRALAALAGWAVLVSTVQAQDGGIVVLGRREGSLQLEFAEDGAKSTAGRTTEFTLDEGRADERALLRGDLFVVDPSFVTGFYGANFGFIQDRLTTNGQHIPGKGHLLGYDLGGTVLPDKQYSASVFANRTQSIDSREFIGMTDTMTKNTGAMFYLKSFILPSTLSYRKEFFQEASQLGGFLGRSEYARNILSYDGRNSFASHDVSVNYTLSDIQDHVRPELDYHSRSADIRDRYTSGEDLPNVLVSSLHYFDRSGSLQFSSLLFDEDYRFSHTESLNTDYRYNLSRFTTGNASTTTSQTAAASLQHRLYESLRTGLGVFGTVLSAPEGGSRIWAGRADTSYKKSLPRRGQLLASLGGLYQYSSNNVPGREIAVFQEKHTARVATFFRLDQPLAIASTVVVTGEKGAIFSEGLDYLLRTIGEFVEIEILASGRIRDGDSLLVDYQIAASPSIRFSTRSLSARVGPDFGWINPYYEYQRHVQTLLAGVAEGPLENLTARTAGVRFRWSGRRVSGSLLNEYHTQDSRLIPYTSFEFSQFVSSFLHRSFTLSLSADESFFHYRIPERRTASGMGRFAAEWMPRPTVSIDAFAAVRLWNDTLSADETFQDAGIRGKWSMRSFTLASSFTADTRRRNGTMARQFRWVTDIARRF